MKHVTLTYRPSWLTLELSVNNFFREYERHYVPEANRDKDYNLTPDQLHLMKGILLQRLYKLYHPKQ